MTLWVPVSPEQHRAAEPEILELLTALSVLEESWVGLKCNSVCSLISISHKLGLLFSTYMQLTYSLTLNDQPHVMAGCASNIFGSTCVHACITALDRSDCQGSIGKDSNMRTINHRPPLFMPDDFRLWLPIGRTLQADGPTEHCSVLCMWHAQDRRNWRIVPNRSNQFDTSRPR